MKHHPICTIALLLVSLGAQAHTQPQGLTVSLAPSSPQCATRLQQEGGQQARDALEREDYQAVRRAMRTLESCTLTQKLLATTPIR